jgi:hypothetical protein
MKIFVILPVNWGHLKTNATFFWFWVEYSGQIIFLQKLKMQIFFFYMLVLKPDGLVLSLLKQKPSIEFKHRPRMAATAQQALHKNH